jgi:hypothetical protein
LELCEESTQLKRSPLPTKVKVSKGYHMAWGVKGIGGPSFSIERAFYE